MQARDCRDLPKIILRDDELAVIGFLALKFPLAFATPPLDATVSPSAEQIVLWIAEACLKSLNPNCRVSGGLLPRTRS